MIAGLILGLTCIGLSACFSSSPRRIALLLNVRDNRWWYARIPWFYSLPTMTKHLDEDAEAGASRRFFGPVFIGMAIAFTVRAVMAGFSGK